MATPTEEVPLKPPSKSAAFVIGIDFGTDSVRAVVMDAANGDTVGVSIQHYPRWSKGLYCDPRENRFRHHPLDYLETLQASIAGALAQAGEGAASKVRGIAADTTGSTPVLTDRHGVPLALTPGFRENPDAMFILWKDHTAVAQAERINHTARTWGGTDFTKYEGGIYSSEWFWAKVLRLAETAPEAVQAASSVLELCDWIPAVLTGTTELARIKRSRCAAGHKAMWHAEFGGYPDDAFLALLHPRLVELKASLGRETFTSDVPFGTLSGEWATKLGLPPDTVVAVGAFDAHMGAVGGNIGPHQLLKILGTSCLDMAVAPKGQEPERLVPGICGQVDGSIIPGMVGYEAGQSAFGDVYAWFKKLLAWPLEAILPHLPGADEASKQALADALLERIIPELERAAKDLPPGEDSLLALDWMNGRRTPDANQRLKGAISGISLGTDAPGLYRALVEATAFGSRAIVERFKSTGIRVDRVIAIGGVARKSPFVMQTLADVMNMDIAVSAAEQAVAAGAAMFAAAAAGLYPKVEDAQRAMSSGTEKTYRPDPERARHYASLYTKYLEFGAFVEKGLPQSDKTGR
ncbi:ribulokinase [Stigmatella sp. ncwal1]|uniref:Ribulokinase n=1 Tax=Stigmatella ashevillensis TaxID=2995309 RepID=A0ABT5DJM1_9BACT|nr:ribulokinase [Stigmatella ashevillena]MDC0713721.1 ribulokinase [Stigmatella ashevillena]